MRIRYVNPIIKSFGLTRRGNGGWTIYIPNGYNKNDQKYTNKGLTIKLRYASITIYS